MVHSKIVVHIVCSLRMPCQFTAFDGNFATAKSEAQTWPLPNCIGTQRGVPLRMAPLLRRSDLRQWLPKAKKDPARATNGKSGACRTGANRQQKSRPSSGSAVVLFIFRSRHVSHCVSRWQSIRYCTECTYSTKKCQGLLFNATQPQQDAGYGSDGC